MKHLLKEPPWWLVTIGFVLLPVLLPVFAFTLAAWGIWHGIRSILQDMGDVLYG